MAEYIKCEERTEVQLYLPVTAFNLEPGLACTDIKTAPLLSSTTGPVGRAAGANSFFCPFPCEGRLH